MEAPRIHQTLSIVYASFLASSFVYLLVALFLQTTPWIPPQPRLANPLLGGFLVLALATSIFVLKQKAGLFAGVAAAPGGSFRQILMSRCVFWFALSELPSVLGFVLFILTGSFTGILILVGLSIAALTAARPSLPQLEQFERKFQ